MCGVFCWDWDEDYAEGGGNACTDGTGSSVSLVSSQVVGAGAIGGLWLGNLGLFMVFQRLQSWLLCILGGKLVKTIKGPLFNKFSSNLALVGGVVPIPKLLFAGIEDNPMTEV